MVGFEPTPPGRNVVPVLYQLSYIAGRIIGQRKDPPKRASVYRPIFLALSSMNCSTCSRRHAILRPM